MGFVSSNSTIKVTIIANSTAPTNAVASPSSVCPGVSTNITLTASGGTIGAGAVVQWYTGSCGGTLVGTGNPLTISQTLSSATTYYARYSGDCNETTCVASSQVTVNAIPSTPTITPSGSTSFCTGGSVTLTSSSGSGYLWSTGATTQDINVTNSGSYTVQITDAVGCQSAASAATDVTVNALPVVSNTGNSSLCIGETTQLSPSVGGKWTSNNPLVATVVDYNGVVTGVYAGSTTFTFTSDYPVCSATTSEVTVLATPTSVTVNGAGTFCGNTTIKALGGTGGTIYFQGTTSGGTSTTNVSTSETITASGTYYFRSKSSTDCWGPEGSADVTINSLPVVSNTGNSSLCIGETTQLSASVGGKWTSNNPSVATVVDYNGIVTGVSAGSTTFTFTSDYPVCSATTSEVTVLATPTSVTVNGAGTFCGNTTITALGGTGGTIYFQGTTSGGTSTTNASTSETITASGTYYFRSKSSTDCWGPEGSAVVIINPLPVVSITGNSTIGINETVQLSPSSGGSWVSNNPSVATVLSYNGLVTGVSAGSATFTFTKDYPICSATTLAVLVSGTTSAPTITSTTPASTCGTGIVTLGATASSGIINWYDVSIGGTSLGTGTSFTTPSLSISTSYWVDATDNSLTSSPRTEIVATINSLPTAPTGNSAQSFCSGSSPKVADLSASGTAIQWYANTSGGVPLPPSTLLSDGIHYYASQTVSGCESNARFDVTADLSGGGIWLGTTNSDWNTASNWCGGVPTASTDVVIPVGTPNQPDIGAVGGVCKTLTLYGGAIAGSSITGTGTLTLGGDITVINKGTGTDGADIFCKISLGANRTFTVDDDGTSSADLTISNVISGAFGITKAGAGTMVLSGLNTYTGATTVSSGNLSINVIANSGTASSIGTGSITPTISIGATGVLQYTGTGHSSSRAITLSASGGTIDASGTGTLTLSGGITGSARNLLLTGTGIGIESGVIGTTTGTLTKEGTGTWTLSGNNTYTGATTINNGTLKLGGCS